MNLRTLAGALLLALAAAPSHAQQLKGDVRFYNGSPRAALPTCSAACWQMPSRRSSARR